MPTKPTGLTIDFGGDDVVVSGPEPRLSFVATGDGPYEIAATIDGRPQPAVEVMGHRFIAWPYEPLRSGERVRWRVRTVGAGDEGWSDEHAFEAGLFDADWVARWISPAVEGDAGPGERPAYRLAVEVDLPEELVEARLYATALGVYEAFVNDVRAGSAELLPGSTSYDATVYGQAFDVAAALHGGPNRLELVVSDGWYRGQVGAFRIPADWGGVTAARAELHVRLSDGTSVVVATDESWRSTRSLITRADLMGGQTTDFTAESGWRPVLLDQVAAPPIDWSPAPPVRIIETREPAAVAPVADGVVVDFGQNASGWVRLNDLGPRGTATVIDYGEHVDASGELDTSHLDSTQPGSPPIRFVQRDDVISGGEGEVFEPRHTIHGFRYTRITRPGLTNAAGAEMRVVHTDLQATGGFECSNADLTRLFDVARWSFQGNAVDVPTDCPTRERLGWTGDYQIFCSTATRMYDVLGFSRKWLRSVRDDQLDDGRIANFSPDGRRIKHHLDDRLAMMTGSAGWGDAICEVPWQLYLAYGDERVLAENWEAMTRWVGWALATASSARHASRVERSPEPLAHERYLWDGSFHWGEWTEPKKRAADGTLIDEIQTNPMAWFMADKGEVGTAYLFRSTATIARVAEVLGREGDAARYAEVADAVADAWRTEFLRADGRTTGDSQAGYVRALSFGLIPEALRDAAAARLVELVAEAGGHLTTGFLATADLLPTLADTGHADVAYEVLLQRDSPSWLGMLDRGATTIWEDWDGIDEHGDAHESLNHYSKGGVVRFLHSHLLGMRQPTGSCAWDRVIIAPVPGGGVTWARGWLDTAQGRIAVSWRDEGDGFALDVTTPVPATIFLPSGSSYEIGPGENQRFVG